jgi:hypothetical protein
MAMDETWLLSQSAMRSYFRVRHTHIFEEPDAWSVQLFDVLDRRIEEVDQENSGVQFGQLLAAVDSLQLKISENIEAASSLDDETPRPYALSVHRGKEFLTSQFKRIQERGEVAADDLDTLLDIVEPYHCDEEVARDYLEFADSMLDNPDPEVRRLLYRGLGLVAPVAESLVELLQDAPYRESVVSESPAERVFVLGDGGAGSALSTLTARELLRASKDGREQFLSNVTAALEGKRPEVDSAEGTAMRLFEDLVLLGNSTNLGDVVSRARMNTERYPQRGLQEEYAALVQLPDAATEMSAAMFVDLIQTVGTEAKHQSQRLSSTGRDTPRAAAQRLLMNCCELPDRALHDQFRVESFPWSYGKLNYNAVGTDDMLKGLQGLRSVVRDAYRTGLERGGPITGGYNTPADAASTAVTLLRLAEYSADLSADVEKAVNQELEMIRSRLVSRNLYGDEDGLPEGYAPVFERYRSFGNQEVWKKQAEFLEAFETQLRENPLMIDQGDVTSEQRFEITLERYAKALGLDRHYLKSDLWR